MNIGDIVVYPYVHGRSTAIAEGRVTGWTDTHVHIEVIRRSYPGIYSNKPVTVDRRKVTVVFLPKSTVLTQAEYMAEKDAVWQARLDSQRTA
jgi:hypothetical protein